MLSRLLVLIVSLLVMAGPIVAPAPVDAGKKRFRVVTRVFTRVGDISIPAFVAEPGFEAAPYPSVIEIGGFKRGKVLDVNLQLIDFSHFFSRDVDVLLVAPNGRSALVMGDIGSATSPFVFNLILELDDQAADPLPEQPSPLVSGVFQPANYDGAGDEADFPAPAPKSGAADRLAVFNGSDPNGKWRLYVVDDNVDDDNGSIAGWALELRVRAEKR